ncbi:MAG TPA: PASTA domain-containing protein [Gaiellaceae bacterium]|nr:PASTA domain-containing protein [Gaiellaceae bacterium]
MAATGARSVAVSGDVRNSVIVTGDNVNLQVQLDGIDGALLHRLREVANPVALPVPIDSRPRRYPDHVDRESEAGAVIAAAQQGGVINVYGEAGIGKTHVLSHVAHDPAGGALPDGIVHVDALDAPLDDALQALFEEFYDCGNPAVRPSRSSLRRALHDRRALVVVDDLGLQREEAQAVLSAAPGCAFVIASTARTVWDGEAIQLAGLPPEFALAIVEQEIGRPLTPDERVEAESLCNALGGHPWRIREAAARARDEGRSLAEAARALDPTATFAALTSGEEGVLAGLAAVGGGPVGLDHVRELSPVEDVRPVLEGLERRHLVLTHSPRYSLPEPLAEEIGRRTDLDSLRARALEHFTVWAEREPSAGAVAAERPAVLELLRWASRTGRDKEAIRLGRATEDAFAAAGRFGTWGAAVETVLAAARRLGDLHEEAWALHQRGTRTFVLDESKAALPDLERARDIRRQIGDQRGERASQDNIDVIQGGAPWWRFGDSGSKWWLVALIGIGLVLIAAAVGGALALRDDDEGPTTTTGGLLVVPGVVGESLEDAIAELEDAGLQAAVAQPPPEDLDPMVTEQDPAEGAEVEPGSVVNLVAVAQSARVPDVRGLGERAALNALANAGLTGRVTERAFSDQVPAGQVSAQDPEPGEIVPLESIVELTASLGPPPDLAVQIDAMDPVCDGGCQVSVTFTVTTVNDAPVREPFDVLIEVTPDGAMTIEIGGLEAGRPLQQTVTVEVEENCFDPDCTAIVTVDPEERIPDPNRENNRAEFTDSGVDLT